MESWQTASGAALQRQPSSLWAAAHPAPLLWIKTPQNQPLGDSRNSQHGAAHGTSHNDLAANAGEKPPRLVTDAYVLAIHLEC